MIVTQAAKDRITELLSLESSSEVPTPPLFFRVYVRGGGCSGLQYGFGFESEYLESDTTLSVDEGKSLRVDPISWMYLSEATVDYVTDLSGARFVVHNPQVQTQCHCGSSFSFGA